jgi:hypothetical protein
MLHSQIETQVNEAADSVEAMVMGVEFKGGRVFVDFLMFNFQEQLPGFIGAWASQADPARPIIQFMVENGDVFTLCVELIIVPPDIRAN